MIGGGGRADSLEPKEPWIRWSQGRANPSAAARGDKMAMRPFVKILRLHVIVIIMSISTEHKNNYHDGVLLGVKATTFPQPLKQESVFSNLSDASTAILD